MEDVKMLLDFGTGLEWHWLQNNLIEAELLRVSLYKGRYYLEQKWEDIDTGYVGQKEEVASDNIFDIIDYINQFY